MTACPHRFIRGWHDAVTAGQVEFWSCADCGRRFEPVQLRDPLSLTRIFAAAERAGSVIVNDPDMGWTEAFAREIERELGVTGEQA